MNKLMAAAMALSVLATAGAAAAQPGPQRHDGGYDQNHRDNNDNNGGRDDNRGDNGHDNRGDNNGNHYGWEQRANHRYHGGRYQAPRGYQARNWQRGERLPASYRGRAYVVDYHRYGLRAPPRGYQYVRVENDVFLTAVATGVITSVILQLFQ